MNTDITVVAAFILKILFLLGLGVYTVFAVVIVRQEYLMAHVLEESFEPVLRFLVYLHLAVAVGIFLLALVVL